VLPYVAGKDRRDPMGDRRVSVVGRDNVECAIGFLHQPGPSAAEMGGGGIGELLFERGEVAERLLDCVADLAPRLAAAARLHRGPVKAVIKVLGGVVEQSAGACALDDLLEPGVLELASLDQVVEVVDIGGVMFAVMELKRLSGNM